MQLQALVKANQWLTDLVEKLLQQTRTEPPAEPKGKRLKQGVQSTMPEQSDPQINMPHLQGRTQDRVLQFRKVARRTASPSSSKETHDSKASRSS